MTRRGFWFLAVAGGALVVSLALPAQFSVTLLSLTAILWYGFSWTLLRLRRDLIVRRLRPARWINNDRLHPGGPMPTLWEDQPVVVWVKLEGAPAGRLPRLTAVDRLPSRALVRGSYSAVGLGSGEESIAIGYELRPKFPGRLRFEGVELEITDLAGFFRMRLFLHGGEEAMVFPRLVGDPRSPLTEKRQHQLLAAGSHRYRRPGSGTELLGLRDYVAGDPPKRIAWRISARRDIWTTKEFESDVPVRTTLFLDHSSAVRVGWPGSTPLLEAVRLSAALARYWLDNRDPVGLVLVDEDRTEVLPPAVGRRHENRLLRLLCQVTAEPPRPSFARVGDLLERTREACERLYPELLDPVLHRRYTPRDHWGGGLRRLATPAAWMALLLLALSRFLPADQFQWALAGSLAGAATLLLIGGVYAIVARRRSGREWLGFKATRTRQEIATILASVYRLGPEAIGQMMEQDAHFSRNAQQFLIDHDYPYPRPLHDDTGRYVFASTGKIERLTKALLRSISTAQDNELFLLVVDLLEVDEINPLLDAIRVARARHHEVVIALPWPAELDEPDTDHAPTSGTATPLDLVEHYFTSYRQLAKTLQPLGVSLLLARPGRPAQQLVQRVEALRAARIRARR